MWATKIGIGLNNPYPSTGPTSKTLSIIMETAMHVMVR